MTAPLALLLLVLTGTCAGSVLPGRWLPSWLPNDKLLHAAAYGTLTALALAEFGLSADGLLAAAAIFLVGLGLEAVQHHVPGRSFSAGDVAANVAGMAAGLMLHLLLVLPALSPR